MAERGASAKGASPFVSTKIRTPLLGCSYFGGNRSRENPVLSGVHASDVRKRTKEQSDNVYGGAMPCQVSLADYLCLHHKNAHLTRVCVFINYCSFPHRLQNLESASIFAPQCLQKIVSCTKPSLTALAVLETAPSIISAVLLAIAVKSSLFSS